MNEIEGRSLKGLRDHLIQSRAKSTSRKVAPNDPGRDSTALDNETASMAPAASVLERQSTITGAKASRRNEREQWAWSGPSTLQSASATGQGKPELSVSKPWRGALYCKVHDSTLAVESFCGHRKGNSANGRSTQPSPDDRTTRL